MPRLRSCVVALAGMLFFVDSAQAATFHLAYDDHGDQTFGTDAIVGTGTFSYDGPAVAGLFPLSSLSGLTFDAIILGTAFGTADLVTDPTQSGISVFELGGGEMGLVFTGSGGLIDGSAFELLHPPDAILSHLAAVIFDPNGCCSGNGRINLYQAFAAGGASYGDYVATTAAIPEPASMTLVVVGLLGLAARRRRVL